MSDESGSVKRWLAEIRKCLDNPAYRLTRLSLSLHLPAPCFEIKFGLIEDPEAERRRKLEQIAWMEDRIRELKEEVG